MSDLSIYLFKTCGKQYTDKTTDYFRSRWNKARKAESANVKNVNQKSYRVTIYNQITKVFLKTWKLD